MEDNPDRGLDNSEQPDDVNRTAKDVAENILIWAKENNLFSAVDLEDVVEDDALEPAMLPQQMFSEVGTIDVLRKRSVNHVAYNERDRKVIVFTNAKLSKADEKFLPFNFSGIEIDYMKGGIAQVKASSPAPDRAIPYHLIGDAVACGSSVFPVNCQGAGTFGALVRDGDGKTYGLSNNHVTGGCNHAMPGLPILFPGTCDATSDHISPFCIGRHSRLLPINDGIPENVDISVNSDAAIFSIEDNSRVSSMQAQHYDTPASVKEPEPGMRVEKVGRTTGLTAGRIIGTFVKPFVVGYNLREYGINKAVFFSEVYIVEGDNNRLFSKPGDSGSLVTMFDQQGVRHSCGLVFAGNELNGQSFILSLPKIMYTLGVELVSGHNTS